MLSKMLTVRDAQEFSPFGRLYLDNHPGPIKKLEERYGTALVQAMQDIRLETEQEDTSWKVRNIDEGVSEELYRAQYSVIWSRTEAQGTSQLLQSYTLQEPIVDVHWCSFLLPPECKNDPSSLSADAQANSQHSIAIVQQFNVSVFTTEGQEYSAALPFQIKQSWQILNGLLFERAGDLECTPVRCENPAQRLPILFSMLHPLDDITPVLLHTTGPQGGRLSYLTDPGQQLVHTFTQPSLAVSYNSRTSAHSVWVVRRTKPEEVVTFLDLLWKTGAQSLTISDSTVQGSTPGFSKSSSTHLSRLTISGQSPLGVSPFHSYHSRLNSPLALTPSRLSSPSAHTSSSSSSAQPSVLSELTRLAWPEAAPSPAQQQMDRGGWGATQPDAPTPIYPEVCLDHLWTESGMPRDGPKGKASTVFITTDFYGQKYLCLLTKARNQLRCVKFEASNDNTQLIFGAMSVIVARDAVNLDRRDMMVVLDMGRNVVLYSGLTKINRVHILNLPASSPPRPNNQSFLVSHHPRDSLEFAYDLGGPVTSSRPPSALDLRLDDSVGCLSPVVSDTETGAGDASVLESGWELGGSAVIGLREGVGDGGVTVIVEGGVMYRMCFPSLSNNTIVLTCLSALRMVLPREATLSLFIRWYSSNHTAGSSNGSSSWHQFSRCLLALLGLQAQDDEDLPSDNKAKRPRPSRQSLNSDWLDLINSSYHKGVQYDASHTALDYSAPLLDHVWTVLFALHLVYEEMQLNQLMHQQLQPMAMTLHRLACALDLDLYVDMYCRLWPALFQVGRLEANRELLERVGRPANFDARPPHLVGWLQDMMEGQSVSPFPYIPTVSVNTVHFIVMYVLLLSQEPNHKAISWTKYLHKSCAKRAPDLAVADILHNMDPQSNGFQRVVYYAANVGTGIGQQFVDGPVPCLPLQEAMLQCRDNPPTNWPRVAYHLIGRLDLAQQNESAGDGKWEATETEEDECKDDGMGGMDQEVLGLRFSTDLRVKEVRRLLRSSYPVKICITQRPEVSDHNFIEEQERHLLSLCIRTVALPVGRGVFTLRTFNPIPTEPLPIPLLCLKGRSYPRNTTVELAHIDVPVNMLHWPQFHNGVAAGLRIAGSTLNSTWILYNKPKDVESSNAHGGFLLGLGLNGHLGGLAMLNIHDYLCQQHELISVGLLLGIAAGKRGTMDITTTKMLSIHIPALLPPTSTELDLHSSVQVASILGVGLVYQGTAHRHIAEVLLNEIGRPAGPELENCSERESHSLTCGLALGLVMLCKGSEVSSMADLPVTDMLYHYMVGGHRKPASNTMRDRFRTPSYLVQEGPMINVNITSPGATLALGLMFHRTNNSEIAGWLDPPQTQYLLDFIRPDLLLLRTISRNLIMWDNIHPSVKWIYSNIPPIVLRYAFNETRYQNDPDIEVDFESCSQAYCNLLAGACFSLALKFSGSCNNAAYEALYEVMQKALKLQAVPILNEQAGRSCIESSVIVILLSLAVVMAGSGHLEVLRLCRFLRHRVGGAFSNILYGSHMMVGIATGLLFMGGGRFSLKSTPDAVAALICALYPKFPIHSRDNRYHLQAFRHLYVLATEPRLLIPRAVNSNTPCYVPVKITLRECESYNEQSFTTMAPTMLPELNSIKKVEILGPRYWPIEFDLDRDVALIQRLLGSGGWVLVQQRSGHLPYQEDPKGYHSALAKMLTQEHSLRQLLKLEDAKSMTSEALVLSIAKFFCRQHQNDDYGFKHFLSTALYECIAEEKLEAIAHYVQLHKCGHQQVCGVQLLNTFYERLRQVYPEHTRTFISQELLTCLTQSVSARLDSWLNSQGSAASLYAYYKQQPIKDDPSGLAQFVMWFRLPGSTLLQSLLTGRTNYIILCKKLQQSGLPLSCAYGLSKVSEKLKSAIQE